MDNSHGFFLTVGGQNVPLKASLEALEVLSQEFGIGHVRDLISVLLNPSPGQLISILTAFAGAAGVGGARLLFAQQAIDLGEALAVIARAIAPTITREGDFS